jgi:hypothetical protein
MGHGYQCCVIDPEGDYEELGDAILFGSPQSPPEIPAIFTALERPDASVIVNLLGVKLDDRPAFFAKLLMRLHESRTRTGRPHWVLVDEAPQLLTEGMTSMIFVTVHPEQLARTLLPRVDVVAAIGDAPLTRMAPVASAAGEPLASDETVVLESGEALVWIRHSGEPPFRLRLPTSTGERRRHLRKYAEGELGPDRSFYFRGPEGKLNLRAQNLLQFLEIAAGVDDDTWAHHFRQGDYSRWFRDVIKDAELAAAAAAVERDRFLSRDNAIAALRAAVESRYTLPADAPLPVRGAS